MKVYGLDDIEFSDSYVLGWRRESNKLVIYLYVLLRKTHPDFKSFDEKKEFGCYRNSCLVFNNVINIEGLPSLQANPKWNPSLNEYEDFGEINDVMIEEKKFYIETDDWTVIVAADEVSLQLEGE